MSADEKMSLEERRKYLKVMQKRYRQAGRVEQGISWMRWSRSQACTAKACSGCWVEICSDRHGASNEAEAMASMCTSR